MYNLVSNYKPSGDQPKAINELVSGIKEGKKHQVLLGATGTGKTFTIANVIKEVDKPTLILAHNKTLAGQLYSEFKELFPDNRVEYFVSYYDYYQPEAYVPSTDTYIEKDAKINDEIDELRHKATSALLSRRDVIVVASVSCIYGIGEVEEYKNKMLTLTKGDNIDAQGMETGAFGLKAFLDNTSEIVDGIGAFIHNQIRLRLQALLPGAALVQRLPRMLHGETGALRVDLLRALHAVQQDQRVVALKAHHPAARGGDDGLAVRQAAGQPSRDDCRHHRAVVRHQAQLPVGERQRQKRTFALVKVAVCRPDM